MRVSTASSTGPQLLQALYLSQLAPGRILNLGAGRGLTPPAQTVVVNVDHVKPASPTSAFVVGDAAALSFADEAFDAVLLVDVIEHVGDPIGILREAARVTRRGGTLIVQTPRAIPRAVWNDPTHVRGFTSRALLTALDRGGWVPLHEPKRVGGFPGCARLHLVPHLETIMRVPGFGHRFGINWVVRATPAKDRG